MDAKYGFIHGALQEAGYQTGNKKDTYQVTHLIDNVITNKYVGFPIFILMIWVMFETTFSLGQYPMNWIEAGVEWIGSMISEHMTAGPLKDMLIDGVIGGVGTRYSDIMMAERYCWANMVPIIIMYIGKRAEQLMSGRMSIVIRRERRLSIVRVAITAGTLHPKPMMSGMNDLPCSPILCISLSMIKAARAI